MELQYRVSVCGHCREHGAEHVKHDGEHYGRMVLQNHDAPKIPTNCQCALILVGNCSICDRTAEHLGPSGPVHVQLGIKLTDSETKAESIRAISVCGSCMLLLANAVMHLAGSGQLDAIQAALQPRIIPAGAARLDKPSLGVIPGGKFRNH